MDIFDFGTLRPNSKASGVGTMNVQNQPVDKQALSKMIVERLLRRRSGGAVNGGMMGGVRGAVGGMFGNQPQGGAPSQGGMMGGIQNAMQQMPGQPYYAEQPQYSSPNYLSPILEAPINPFRRR